MEEIVQRNMFYDDLAVGDTFDTPGRTIGESDVALFAGLSGDYNPIHTDAEFAKASSFGTRIAHGLLGLSVATGLVARLGIFDGTALALLGIEDWRFTAPIKLGDTIRVHMEIARLRALSDGQRGIAWRATQLLNQQEEVLQEGTLVVMLKRRAGEAQGPLVENQPAASGAEG